MSDGQLPIVRATELIRVLRKLGFARTRKSRSGHQRFSHPDGRKTTIPVHKGKTIGRGLLHKILGDIGIDADELRRLL